MEASSHKIFRTELIMSTIFRCLKEKSKYCLAGCNKKLNEYYFNTKVNFINKFDLKKDEKGNVIPKKIMLPDKFFSKCKYLKKVKISVDDDDELLDNIFNHITEAVQLEEFKIVGNVYSNYVLKFPNQMDKLRIMDLTLHRIEKIEGLENLNKLEVLSLKADVINIENLIEKLTKLKKLRIKAHESNIKLDSISSIEGLEELEISGLVRGFLLKNADFVKDLKNLRILNLNNNKELSDINSIFGLENLEELDLAFTAVKDLSNLKAKNIKKLDLTCLALNNFSFLADLKEIEYLDLFNTKFGTNIRILSSLIKIRHLNIGKNEITNISVLSNLTDLEELYIYDNRIDSIKPLEGLKNLRILAAHRNNISDISPLSSLLNLEILRLSKNTFKSVNALSSLTNLRELNLSGIEGLKDISPLANLHRLKELDLYYTLTNIEKLEPLVRNGTIIRTKNN